MLKTVTILLLLCFVAVNCGGKKKDVAREPTPLSKFKTTIKVKHLWRSGIGKNAKKQFVSLQPFLVDDRIFTTNYEGRVTAFDAIRGRRLWSVETEVNASAGVNGDADMLLIGTDNAELIALNAQDGTEKWRTKLSSEVAAISRISIGIGIARTIDGKVFAVDAESGEVLWQHSNIIPVLTLHGASRPVITGAKLFIGLDTGKLQAMALSQGRILWDATIAAPKGRTELERMVDIDGTMKIDGGTLFVASYQGRVAAVGMANGQVLWARELSSYAGLDVDTSQVYVSDENSYIWAFDRRTGTPLWKQEKLHNRRITVPAVVGDYLVVGDFEGYLHWMSKWDGHFVARTRPNKKGFLSAPLALEDRAYIITKTGVLVAMQISSRH